jgi:thiopeptide-type bacteriocin biosynthesis protein
MSARQGRLPAAGLPFTDSGFFVLRTPLLPFQELQRWGEGLEAAQASPEELDSALARDRERLRAHLRRLLELPEVREALFVASPALHESLPLWLKAPDSERGAKVERSLVRYLARMAGRPTPFGLFAGCSVGDTGSQTHLRLGSRREYQRHTRLDMDYVCALSERLSNSPELRPHLRHAPNDSLYRASGQLRYTEGRLQGRTRSYHLVAVEPDTYLEATLARASQGARPPELARALCEADPDIGAADAEEYIGTLIDNQLLVSELRPPVTGPEPLPGLISRLKELPGEGPVCAERLARVHGALEELDGGGVGAQPERYQDMARLLSELPAPAELPPFFQVDMFKPAPGLTLGARVLRELALGVQVLHRLAPRPREDDLSRFREAFAERYEEREVPLLEVLDEEAGLGFGRAGQPGTEAAPLLEGLALAMADGEPRVGFGVRQSLLLRRLQETVQAGEHELRLTERDLEAMQSPERLPLPDAFSVTGTVVADSEADVEAGRFQLCLDTVSGPSGALILGRFCHGDEALHEKVRAHLRAEEALRPEAAFVELVHLPEGRVGNILARPVLRAYELPFLGRSGAPAEQQLALTDLRVSIRGGRIVLRSERLGRELIPRLTNAHNYASRSLSLYRFLCMLQQQEVAGGLSWDWGPLGSAGFLPRVSFGRLILSLARWVLAGERLKPLGEAQGAKRFAAVQALRRELRLPRWVALADGDNVLPVDLDNVLSVETFVHLIKDRPGAWLVELFPEPEGLCVEGAEGRFVHELVVPFVRTEPAAVRVAARAPAAPVAAFPRSFPPGSEWLYTKLYAGAASVDRLLTQVVAPVVASVLGSGAADRWFFIRFGDPQWHLRLRFHGAPRALRNEVLEALSSALEPLRQQGVWWKLQLDTYEREVERYGGPEAMLLAEQLFQVDSEAVLSLLAQLSGDAGADARWRLALRGMDLLLSDLGLDLEARARVARQARDGFGQEFRSDAELERQLASRFRQERRALDSLLDDQGPADAALAPGLAVLRERSRKLAPLVAELRGLQARGQLSVPLEELAWSFLHMHVNRMSRAAARPQEMALYDLLTRLYSSRVAVRKTRPPG